MVNVVLYIKHRLLLTPTDPVYSSILIVPIVASYEGITNDVNGIAKSLSPLPHEIVPLIDWPEGVTVLEFILKDGVKRITLENVI